MTIPEIECCLDDLCSPRDWEWGIRAEVASLCAWSAELRVTPVNKDTQTPDRSYVTFAGGGMTADEAISRAYTEMHAWLTGVHPELELEMIAP